VPSSNSPGAWGATLPLYTYFLRLPDTLVSVAHFRPEVLRRVKATREEESNKIKKVDLDGKAEERRLQAEKTKRQQRDAKLKTMRNSWRRRGQRNLGSPR
jgi:Skp family chaperone for outer membrane proteins